MNRITSPSVVSCRIAGMLALLAAQSAQAAGMGAFVPVGVDCPVGSSGCGLYLDLSGDASVNWVPPDSFSYQPSYTQGGYRYVSDDAAAMGSVSSSQVQAADFVTFGALKSQLASGSTSNGSPHAEFGPPHTRASSSSNIGFQDRLTVIAASALTNTLGTMVARVQVTGGVSASPATYPASNTSASATVSVPGASYSVVAYGDRSGTGGIPRFITFELPVKFNSTDFTALSVFLQTSVTTGTLWGPGLDQAVSSNADFFSTLEWVGIDSMHDATGNAVSGWSISSRSGFDYGRSYAAQLAVVPVPPAFWLLGSACAWLATVRSRKVA